MVFALIITALFVIAGFVFIYFQKPAPTDQKTHYTSKYISIQGHKIHYIQEGNGPHVVLLHGIGASTFTWRFLVHKLSRHYTVTVPDMVGFGQSAKPADFTYNLDDQCRVLDEFFNILDIPQMRIVASSMGGAVALWYAKLHPKKVLGIVAISPALDPTVLRYDLQKLQFLGPFVSPLVTRKFVKQILKRVVSNADLVTDENLDAYYKPYSQAEAIQSFIKSISVLRDRRLAQELDSIQIPLLIVWGANDKIVPLKVGEKIKTKFPRFQFISHPTAGHHVMEDDPNWLFEQVCEFFDTHPEE